MDRGGIIYQIRNKVNGKLYIGQTIRSLEDRWSGHKSDAKYGGELPICRAISKYGSDNFEVSEIAKASSRDELDVLEQKYIRELNTLKPNGYNLREGGHTARQHPESVEKMRQSLRGLLAGEKHPNWGKHPSEETRRKLREARRKHPPMTEENKEKLRQSMMGNKYALGWHPSDETRKKMSMASTGRKPGLGKHPSDETRRKQSETMKQCGYKPPSMIGTKQSEEHRKKTGDAHRGKRLSIETRIKISESLIGNQRALNHHLSGEAKQKIREKKVGIKLSPERVDKIRQALIRRWQNPEYKEKHRQMMMGNTRQRRKQQPQNIPIKTNGAE